MLSADGTFGRPGMVITSPVTTTTNSAPADKRNSRTGTICPVGAPRFDAIGRERILRLGHAHWQVAEARRFEILELRLDACIAGDVCGAIDFGRDGVDLVAQLHVVRIKRLEVGFAFVDDGNDVMGERFRACAAIGPVRAHERFRAHAFGGLHHFLNFSFRIGDELVDRDDGRNAELIDVLDVALEVVAALGNGGRVLVLQVVLGDAAVHLQARGRLQR